MIDEGYVKYESHWRKTAALDNPLIATLNEWRRPLYAAGLIGHYADEDIGYGNISARIAADRRFIISGTQTGHLPELSGEHYALVTGYDIDLNRVFSTGATQASSESLTHAAIYELDPDIGAVVHVHSAKLWSRLINTVATTDARTAYGTPDMAREFRRLFLETDFSASRIAVMAGHESGLISIGENMQEASENILSRHAQFA